jgi:PAS domain S-box-containing protein
MTTPTPSLGRRVVVVGVAVVALVLLAVNAGVYVALRANLLRSLDAVLAERAETVRVEQREVPIGDGAELARRLQARGLRAEVRTADGQVFRSDPSSPVLSGALPPSSGDEAYTSREVPLPGGATAEVFARTSGVSGTLRRLLALQVLGSLAALGLAALLLARATRFALRPVADLERRTGTLETRWRQVLEAAQEAYVAVDAAGAVVDWNQRAEQLFGWRRDEALGRPVDLLVPEDDRPVLAAALAELVQRGPDALGPAYELVAVTGSGTWFDAEATVWGVDRRGGSVVHAFVRDVSERRRSQEAVARLAAVVESSADAIITQAPDGTILTWNGAAELSYGWDAEEAVGSHVSLVALPAELSEHAVVLGRLAGGAAAAGFEGERRTRGGELVPVSVRFSPVHDVGGDVVAVSSIARDITEQRFLAGALDETLVALETALDEARASEERTREFLDDAAHQLRTPVAGIRACAETLLRGVPPEAADELLASMVRETSRAARLVTSLLQMARLDQGEALSPAPCDVVDVCRDEVDRARVLASDLVVRLEAEPLPPLPLDRKALHEVVANLVDNARRHAATTVLVDVRRAGGAVEVRVSDDGPGVPVEQRDRVFQRFVSLDGRGGSGLGLPIARGYARAMGGELSYDDDGFVLTLPLPAD